MLVARTKSNRKLGRSLTDLLDVPRINLRSIIPDGERNVHCEICAGEMKSVKSKGHAKWKCANCGALVGKSIQSVFVFVLHHAGCEEFLFVQTQNGMMPLMTTREEEIPDLMERAREIARHHTAPIRLLKLSNRELLSVVTNHGSGVLQ